MTELTVYDVARRCQLPPAAVYPLMASGVIASRRRKAGLTTTESAVQGWVRQWAPSLASAARADVP